jgi:hypothetical protein
MDRKTRELQRRWQESRDVYEHAALLTHLKRCGLLEERKILCAGFFGHKACRMAMPEEIKRHKVVITAHFGAKTLHTEELNDFIFNIFYWPRDIYLRTVRAALQLSANHQINTDIPRDIKVINGRLLDYIEDKSTFEEFRTSVRRSHSWFMWFMTGPYNSRQNTMARHMSSLLRNINDTAVLCSSLQGLGAQFKDKIFRKAIGDEVIPYLLGEWK